MAADSRVLLQPDMVVPDDGRGRRLPRLLRGTRPPTARHHRLRVRLAQRRLRQGLGRRRHQEGTGRCEGWAAIL
jgi:hypothetical protein